jgi:cobalt/nickel transport system permease protein
MAHIPDGVLSGSVLAAGAIVSAGLMTIALRRLDFEQIPQAAVLSASFFVASLIHIPMGATSAHLLLNGLMGLLLGWTAVPAILVALLLQAAFFGYGGIVVLGVNSMNLVVPALICAYGLRPLLRRGGAFTWFRVGAAAGFAGVFLTGLMVTASLLLSGDAFAPAARLVLFMFLPLALLEGMVTGTVMAFIGKVAPEYLTVPHSHDV